MEMEYNINHGEVFIENRFGKKPGLYGYKNEYDVYKDIENLLNMDKSDRKEILMKKRSTSHLRDIKMRIKSKGTIGFRNELYDGITEVFNSLLIDKRDRDRDRND